MGNETSSPGGPPLPSDIKVQWESTQCTAGVMPGPREAHAAVVIGSKLFCFGGGANLPTTGPFQSNELFTFELGVDGTGSWVQPAVQGTVPAARTGCASVAVGTKMFIFGGLNSSQGWMSDFHVLDTETMCWTDLTQSTTGPRPSPRDKLRCVAVGSKIYFFGGFGPQQAAEEQEEEAATFGWFNDLHSFDTGTLAWQKEEVEGNGPSPRAAFGMCVMGGNIVVCAGRDTSQRVNDVHVLDATLMKWVPMKMHGAFPACRSFLTLTAVSDSRAILFGGLNSTNVHQRDVHILVQLDAENWGWQQCQVEGTIAARGFHSSTVLGNKLVVFGGSADFDAEIHECKTYLNDVHTLDIGPVVSAPIPAVPQPPPPQEPATIPQEPRVQQ